MDNCPSLSPRVTSNGDFRVTYQSQNYTITGNYTPTVCLLRISSKSKSKSKENEEYNKKKEKLLEEL